MANNPNSAPLIHTIEEVIVTDRLVNTEIAFNLASLASQIRARIEPVTPNEALGMGVMGIVAFMHPAFGKNAC